MDLRGRTVLLTRTREQSEELSRAIQERGGIALLLPMIRILPPESWMECDRALSNLSTYEAVVLASANAAHGFLSRAKERRADLSRGRILALGRATARSVESYGLRVEPTSGDFTATALARHLLEERVVGKRYLLPRGDHARGEIENSLRDAGAEVDVPLVYRNTGPREEDRETLLEALKAGKIDLLTFASPSAAVNFAKILDDADAWDLVRRLQVAVIGPTTAEALRDLGLRVDGIAREYTAEGLLSALEGLTEP
jgi:uroporphyrinogen-III synthase